MQMTLLRGGHACFESEGILYTQKGKEADVALPVAHGRQSDSTIVPAESFRHGSCVLIQIFVSDLHSRSRRKILERHDRSLQLCFCIRAVTSVPQPLNTFAQASALRLGKPAAAASAQIKQVAKGTDSGEGHICSSEVLVLFSR